MSTQQSGEPAIAAPNIFDGIYLVYGVGDLGRPVGIVHSNWGAGIVGLGDVVAEEQWLLFGEPEPSNGPTTFKVPGGPEVTIADGAPYPNRLPFHGIGSASLSATVFFRIEGSQRRLSDEVFKAWKESCGWLKGQRYAHFKVSNLRWPPPPNNVRGRIEQMDPINSGEPHDRRISFGEDVVSTPSGTSQRIITAFQTVNQGDRAIAVDIAVKSSTLDHFRNIVNQSFDTQSEPIHAVLSEGQLFQFLPPSKPKV